MFKLLSVLLFLAGLMVMCLMLVSRLSLENTYTPLSFSLGQNEYGLAIALFAASFAASGIAGSFNKSGESPKKKEE